jgi:hypothetical protein
MGPLHEDQCTFFILSYVILLRMRNICAKSCKENKNTLFMFIYLFIYLFICENRAACVIMWRNIVEADRRQKAI